MHDDAWTLTDTGSGLHVENWGLTNQDLGLAADRPWGVRKHRLRGGLQDGVDVIDVDNGHLSFSVLPTRGMSIWRGQYHGIDLGWRSPVRGPVHPCHVRPEADGGVGWLAGFDEWIVRCGINWNGAPGIDRIPQEGGPDRETFLTLHGRIANLPAHRVRIQIDNRPPHAIIVSGEVDEAMLFFPRLRLSTTIRTTPGSNRLSVRDVVTNIGAQPAEMEMLYHINFGPPLLEEGSRIVAPVHQLVPRDAVAAAGIGNWREFPAPTTGLAEQVYFMQLRENELGRTAVALTNAKADKATLVRFPTAQLPCFTLWKNPAALADGYVTGLEPGTNYPNPRQYERSQGRVRKLAPGESHEMLFELLVADTMLEVSAFVAEVKLLQGEVAPHIHSEPQPGFSP